MNKSNNLGIFQFQNNLTILIKNRNEVKMKEINEPLKNKKLSQIEYYKKSFEIFRKLLTTDKKYLPFILIFSAFSGYLMTNSFVIGTISVFSHRVPKTPLIDTVLNFGAIIIIEYALNLFQSNIISKISGRYEMKKTEIALKSLILSITMLIISRITAPLETKGLVITLMLSYFFAYFRQVYLSKKIGIVEAFKENMTLLKNNRMRIILPLILINLVSVIVTTILISYATVNIISTMKSSTTTVAILIIYRLLNGIFEIYKKILRSIICLNVENSKQ